MGTSDGNRVCLGLNGFIFDDYYIGCLEWGLFSSDLTEKEINADVLLALGDFHYWNFSDRECCCWFISFSDTHTHTRWLLEGKQKDKLLRHPLTVVIL